MARVRIKGRPIKILNKRITRFSCEYSVISTVLWNFNMHICISISTHSLFSHVLRCTITLWTMHTHICTVVSDARAIYIMQIDFAEFCRGQSVTTENVLNVHHMHTWVCTVVKWNYEQHLCTHTLIPIMTIFASTNEPLIVTAQTTCRPFDSDPSSPAM